MNLNLALEKALHQTLGSPCPPNLKEAMGYSALAPGKRIRPRIALATGKMLGLSEDEVLPVALALELTHCFTLIHDDLPCMDDDDYRRGQPSNHKVHGEAMALLAGDALIYAAQETFLSSKAPAHRLLQAFRRFNNLMGPRGVIGGQALELHLQEDLTVDQVEQMHVLKTGALFDSAFLVPADLADLQGKERKLLEQTSKQVGLSFQLLDDLEDLTEQEEDPTNLLSPLCETERRAHLQGSRNELHRLTKELEQQWGPSSKDLASILEQLGQRFPQ